MARCAVFLALALSLTACGKAERDAAPGTAPVTRTTDEDASAAFRNVHDGVAYVGDDACFSCHEDLWRGYQTHGMARSYYPLSPERVAETTPGGPLLHPATRLTYRVFKQDGHAYQEEYRLDAAGRKTHSLVRRMDFVVGSGNAARTYLAQQGGRLYELPLTWYAQARKWDFSPGYRQSNGRFDRLIPDGCMACHNSYPTSVPFVRGKYEHVPNGIGCERCHGPGGLHVKERLATPEPDGDLDDTIVNPRHLPLERQLDVCQQCHLHGAVSVERDGRGPFDYRPSTPLSAHQALFALDAPGPSDRIAVISHAERMKRSACFQGALGSARPMTCVTCHDPHEGFRDKGPAYFNQTCLTCHTPESLPAALASDEARRTHTATANCMACHMPRVEAEDAPHSSFTDHWIRVVEQGGGLPEPAVAHTPGALLPYFERDERGPEAAVYAGMAYVVLGKQRPDTSLVRKGVALLEEGLKDHPGQAEARLLLGVGHMALREPARAIPPLEQAVQIDPDNPEYLYGLAGAYEAARRDPAVIARLYQRALAIQPAMAQTRVNYGRFLDAQGRLDEALVQYRQAADEQPWLDVAHFNLGTAYLRQGDAARAETELLRAVELNPDYVEALDNLGLLYADQGRLDAARQRFEQAVAASPNNPTALGNLGTYYLNAGHLSRAIDLLSRAVEAQPTYLNGLVNLALAHFRNDDLAQARRYAQEALRVDPANALAQEILAAR